ncbi:hypothetical protein QOT17_002101 [Balamuthia mandrillaris]
MIMLFDIPTIEQMTNFFTIVQMKMYKNFLWTLGTFLPSFRHVASFDRNLHTMVPLMLLTMKMSLTSSNPQHLYHALPAAHSLRNSNKTK